MQRSQPERSQDKLEAQVVGSGFFHGDLEHPLVPHFLLRTPHPSLASLGPHQRSDSISGSWGLGSLSCCSRTA